MQDASLGRESSQCKGLKAQGTFYNLDPEATIAGVNKQVGENLQESPKGLLVGHVTYSLAEELAKCPLTM